MVGKIPKTKGDKGQRDLELNGQSDLSITDYTGYKNQNENTSRDQTVLALDPY
ncbi:hypothetical protein ACJBWM_11555 [Streptococcus suis]